jgi:hypothetical protein
MRLWVCRALYASRPVFIPIARLRSVWEVPAAWVEASSGRQYLEAILPAGSGKRSTGR